MKDKKKHKTKKHLHDGHRLVRKCPKCGCEQVTKIKTTEVYYVCEKCKSKWRSFQMIKIWRRPHEKTYSGLVKKLKVEKTPMSNKEFKEKLNKII